MAQHYTDPRRESDPHALPDCETFYCDGTPACVTGGDRRWRCESCGASSRDYADDAICGESRICVRCFKRDRRGWYIWACFPGCLPDGDPYGPYATEEDALDDWREMAGVDEDESEES